MPIRRHSSFAFVTLTGFVAILAAPGRAAEPESAAAPVPRPQFECRRAAGPITLDGKADEAAWKSAEVIDNFAPFWLRTSDAPARRAFTKSAARLLWDDQYLYFHAEMDDADLYADVTEQDGTCWYNDVFELFFKPSEKGRGYYEFEVTPKNSHLDMYLPSRGSGGYLRWAKEPQFRWETKVALQGTLNDPSDRDRGWSVEGRFPWSDFLPTGGRPQVGAHWKFTLCRYDYSIDFEQPELSASAPLTRPDYHRYEDYSTLVFVKP